MFRLLWSGPNKISHGEENAINNKSIIKFLSRNLIPRPYKRDVELLTRFKQQQLHG